ncbi:MAG: MmgE/PrpD family protein [Dehalococcoidia bacterium]|nr:MmgE/PrpD family protein [Dehalococcoidia bacterium]
MDASYTLADNVANVTMRDLPPEVVDITRKCILDTFGCILAGSGLSPDSVNVIDLFIQAGGNKESTIIGFNKKLPSWSAAFANGVLAHALDYDDIVDEAGVHPSLCTIPATLALAEKVGGVTGKEFITAIALGNDLICRLGTAIKRKQEGLSLGFRPAPVLGIFGAAAAAGKILKLDREQIVDALGIAFHQAAAGTFEVFLSPGDPKIRELYGGSIGMQAALAALMAQKGVTGIKTSFEGPAGLFNLYFQGKYDRDYLVGDLGTRYDGVNVGLKAWSANRIMHNHVQAALELTREHNINPTDIEQVTLYVTDIQKRYAGADRKKPATSTEARISLPFCVSAAIAHQELSIKSFTPDGLSDKVTLMLAEKIMAEDTSYGEVKSFFAPGKVSIRLKSGDTYTNQVDHPFGHPRNPMRLEDVERKFKDCAMYSRRPGEAMRLWRTLNELETVKDVRTITG